MNAAARPTISHQSACRDPVATPAELEQVAAAIEEVSTLIPPVWPLADYVAVNPFLGLAPRRFLDARQLLRDVRNCELLLPAAHFHDLYALGEITPADV